MQDIKRKSENNILAGSHLPQAGIITREALNNVIHNNAKANACKIILFRSSLLVKLYKTHVITNL
jgi:hypothetical protein